MKSLFAYLLSPLFIKIMRWLFGVLLALVVILSLIPAPDELPGALDLFEWLAKVFLGDAEHGDKVSHFLAYGTLTSVGLLAFIRPLGRWLMLPVLMFFMSGVLELAQGLSSSRMPDWLDFAANGAGVLTGAVVAGCLIYLAQTQRAAGSAAA